MPVAALTSLALWTAMSLWPVGPHLVHASTAADLADLVRKRDGPGAIWVGPLPGNGGRDVVVYVPPSQDPRSDVTLVVHFHGTYGERMATKVTGMRKREYVGRTRLEQTLHAIDELQAERSGNVALVYPVSAGKRKPDGARGWWNYDFDAEWMVPDAATGESFAALVSDARGVLEDSLGISASRVRSTVLAEGHSAGGMALFNVAQHDRALVHEYLFLDAAFEGWADGCHAGIVRHGAGARITIVTTTGGIADPFAGRTPWCVWAEEEGGARWDDARAWCSALRDDMRDMDDVTVVHTKVRHGDQPRRFSGGLGLPDDRFR